jgi:type II secretory pathway component GspD/PulD (secretin)
MYPRIKKRLILIGMFFFCLLVSVLALASNNRLAVIELEHRPADEVIPIISPLLEPGNTLSGDGFQLFLTTSPENLIRIRAIIAHLDRASRQLAITLIQGENALDTLNRITVSGSVAIGDHFKIRAGGRRDQPSNTLAVDARSSRSTQRSTDVQRVLVEDGAAATVYVGLSAPVVLGSPFQGGVRHHEVVGYREMFTGMQVTPRVSGQRVYLEIETLRDQSKGDPSGEMQTQQIRTQVHGSLNEWIEIGGILDTAQRTDTGLTHGQSGRMFKHRQVFVRVEPVP